MSHGGGGEKGEDHETPTFKDFSKILDKFNIFNDSKKIFEKYIFFKTEYQELPRHELISTWEGGVAECEEQDQVSTAAFSQQR